MIKIVGLGPGSSDALTLGTINALKNSSCIKLRTEKHPTVEYIREIGIEFDTYDFAYEKFNSFDEVYDFISDEIIREYEALENKELIYAVPGHPLVAEKSVELLINKCKARNIQSELVTAVSFVDAMLEVLNIDPINGLAIIDAFDIKNQIIDKNKNIIITQVYNKLIASEVKLHLLDVYGDDVNVTFVRAAGVKGEEIVREIPLYELDRVEEIDYLTSIFISSQKNTYDSIEYLVNIMELLRSPEGCPWDREQTHQSIKRCVVEEAYELVEAIENDDDDGIIEELGDLLFQVIFHAQMAREDGYFNLRDIIKTICTKMITRHPHVFSDVKVKNSDEVLSNWDEIKKKEKSIETVTEEMQRVAKGLPALIRAEKIQKKAQKVGFEWDNVDDAFKKVFEEYNEVKDVYKSKNTLRILDEIGDLLFAIVNVSRFLNIDSEDALNSTCNKFISRFEHIEKSAKSLGKTLDDMTLEEMDALWNEAKLKK